MYIGKTVLITGTSRGVGNAIAKHFMYHGATVIGLNKELGRNYTEDGIAHCTLALICDLSKVDHIAVTMGTIFRHFPKIDILINNAAVLTSQYSTKMKSEDAIAMVEVDLLAPFILSKECVKLMKNGGQIVNISSMAVALEPMGDSMYAACKAGLNKMSNIMAKEYAFMGVTVNTLAISAIETDMLRQLNREKVDKVVKGLPLPVYATMDDITNVIDFFCSPRSSYITSQTIYLGGVHA